MTEDENRADEVRHYYPTARDHAIAILDERKRELCSTNLEAWFILCHAKLYLLGTYQPVVESESRD